MGVYCRIESDTRFGVRHLQFIFSNEISGIHVFRQDKYVVEVSSFSEQSNSLNLEFEFRHFSVQGALFWVYMAG